MISRIQFAKIGLSALVVIFIAVNVQQLISILSLWSHPYARAVVIFPLVGLLMGSGLALILFKAFRYDATEFGARRA